jgi:hypothetical protein
MNDRLEDFVRKHREEFDRHEPDPSLWLKIRPVSPASGGQKRMRWIRVVAAVAVIFAGFTAGIYFLSGGKGGTELYGSETLQEVRDAEQYYTRMVAERYNELRPYLEEDPRAQQMLKADMEELDQAYQELKNDLRDNVSNPEVIEAMILNYRVKLEILEDLLNQIKEKEKQDEKNGSYDL